MKDLEAVVNFFGVFHDGSISAYEEHDNMLTLTIECNYLAEGIDPSFTRFYMDLYGIQKIELDPWIDSDPESTVRYNAAADIFKAELEIMSAEIKDDMVFVTCLQFDKSVDYSGGTLCLDCAGIRVFDQDRNEWKYDQLSALAQKLFDEFKARK